MYRTAREKRDKLRGNPLYRAARLTAVNVALSILLLFVSLLVSRWRAEGIGTRYFDLAPGWGGESVGLTNILRGEAASATWNALTESTCDPQANEWLTSNISPCKEFSQEIDEERQCVSFYRSLQRTRCDSYRSITVMNYFLLIASIVMLVFAAISVVIGLTSNLCRNGYKCAFSWIAAGAVGGLLCLSWFLLTHSAYAELNDSQWFPWPSLAICWYLYLYGSLTNIISGVTLSLLVTRLRRGYDPDAERKFRQEQVRQMRQMQMKGAANNEFENQKLGYMGGMPLPAIQGAGMASDFGIRPLPAGPPAVAPMAGPGLPGPMMMSGAPAPMMPGPGPSGAMLAPNVQMPAGGSLQPMVHSMPGLSGPAPAAPAAPAVLAAPAATPSLGPLPPMMSSMGMMNPDLTTMGVTTMGGNPGLTTQVQPQPLGALSTFGTSPGPPPRNF